MKHSGYCPHCGVKITEVENMGFFDDFTFKCWQCKRIFKNSEVNYCLKQAENKGSIDSVQKKEYNRGV